jgi:hypothetical protein
MKTIFGHVMAKRIHSLPSAAIADRSKLTEYDVRSGAPGIGALPPGEWVTAAETSGARSGADVAAKGTYNTP